MGEGALYNTGGGSAFNPAHPRSLPCCSEILRSGPKWRDFNLIRYSSGNAGDLG
ncbi:hypothetical protein PILCRDRAFT_814548 [Piloderma croceum F 1598]|uniref:Uncharacterized protein n=1 Tax=Piloderma croceum (strain F 1598) TaxID=765440 RepID=A0A0C3CDP3_PILCF|nr:hypothetical protein PILCRDRAFT_814548 [Piloderma croceum F 1598]